MNTDLFINSLKKKGIYLNDRQINQFKVYFNGLIEWNKKMNLTSITSQQDVYLKHFYDSISPAFFMNFSADLTVCDVGAGAGFPSIPLKICFPQLKISIVDALKKRMIFLEQLIEELQLTNIHFYHERAENFGQDKEHREKYDYVVARAVARLNVLAEICLPLVKLNGSFIAMKGLYANQEMTEAKQAIALCGGKMENHFSFQLPVEWSERHIYDFVKVAATPKYLPRKAGLPNKKPIG